MQVRQKLLNTRKRMEDTLAGVTPDEDEEWYDTAEALAQPLLACYWSLWECGEPFPKLLQSRTTAKLSAASPALLNHQLLKSVLCYWPSACCPTSTDLIFCISCQQHLAAMLHVKPQS